MRDALEGCTTVETTGEDGTFSLSVTFDTDVSQEGVDEQLTYAAVGTFTDDEGEHPWKMWRSTVRVHNNLTGLHTSESAEHYVSAAVAKLQNVMSG